jgi:hypothetical protein
VDDRPDTSTEDIRRSRQRRSDARRERRRRRLLIGLAVAATVVIVGGAVALGGAFGGEDAETAKGVAAGKLLTAEPTTTPAAELKRENAKLRRKLKREKEAAESAAPVADDAAAGSAAGSFRTLARSIDGAVGIAYGPVGGASQTTLGDWRSGVAWSTAKVPVAVALARQNGGQVTSAMRSAITASNNAGAEAMWSALGSGTRAGRKVNRVLTDAGDATRIQTKRVRSGYTPFGQTLWTLRAQQRFAANLPCIAGSRPVLSLMGQVVSSQRWGLGSIGSSPRFKGGWGPSTSGGYLVRQFGIVRVRGGQLAVSIATLPGDGQFQTGIANLNRLARWIRSNLRGQAAGC